MTQEEQRIIDDFLEKNDLYYNCRRITNTMQLDEVKEEYKQIKKRVSREMEIFERYRSPKNGIGGLIPLKVSSAAKELVKSRTAFRVVRVHEWEDSAFEEYLVWLEKLCRWLSQGGNA